MYGQETSPALKGKVSFITSKNIYVKFDDTKQISIGDTLYISITNSPCLIVTNKSSSSCVSTLINDCDINKDDEILYKYLLKKNTNEDDEKQKISSDC